MFLKQALKKVLKNSFDEPVEIVFWDGEEVKYNEGEALYKIIFHKSISEEILSEDPTLALAESYMDGNIDIEGNIAKLIEGLYRNKKSFLTVRSKILKKLASFKHSKKTSMENAQFHYDIGNDFYKLWLDKSMTYSCAYFKEDGYTLEKAQEEKLNHILKKLYIQPGNTLLDIGCGWGELIIKAAKEYGAKAYGITLSKEQYNKVKERIKNEGLEGKVDVMLKDYRDLEGMKFDRIVSVGMLEHVGKGNLEVYFKDIDLLLNDNGLSLTHSITTNNEGANNVFLNKYIFPGGYVPGIKEIVTDIAINDFYILDVESLRRHYAKTLHCWAEKFEANLDEIRKTKDERFIRMWRLYLNGCEGSFNSGNIDIQQFLFSKGANNELPLTRDYMYK